MGQLSGDGTTYTSEGQGWYLTFGNSASPCINPTIYTATVGGKEILIESNAQYLAVCKSSGTLSLSLVVLIPYPCELDCSALSLAAQVYYINESNPLNLPACMGPNTTTVTGTLR